VEFIKSFSFSISNYVWDVFGVTLSTKYYSNMLNVWSKLPLQNNVDFDGGNSKYSIDTIIL